AATANRPKLGAIADAVLHDSVVAGQEQLIRAIRDHLPGLRSTRCAGKQSITVASLVLQRTPVGDHAVKGPLRSMSCTELEDEIKKWEEKLNSIGDDAQLANVDLQNILQKQQQTLQMMSNISKMLHDTAKSVIRNMRG